jgi:hypothetical protein
MSDNEKDVRQLRKMQAQIALYRDRQLPLKALADDLEFLLSHVEGAVHEWRQEMLSKLGVLEDTYAVALDKTGGAFTSADADRVAVAIGRIAELVESELERSNSEG